MKRRRPQPLSDRMLELCTVVFVFCLSSSAAYANSDLLEFLFTLYIYMRWHPTPVLLPGESHGWGAWRATVHEFAQLHPVQTWLKQLSRHACILCVYCHYYHEPLGKGIKANMIDNGAEDSLSNIKYNTTWVIDQAWLIMTWLMWSMSWFQECVTWTVLDILH